MFVKLSTSLSYESKNIIGTILVSELLHAIRLRPEEYRSHYCIYIDEFQNFASFEYFSVLITQAPKWGVATTIAHHDRYGQLGDDKEIIGATAAIINKILFQITTRDAQEFAPELAENPPTEIRLEEQYAVSKEPVDYLLRWHTNPHIRGFVNKYLRHLQHRQEDTKEDMEAARLRRMNYLDRAGIYSLDEQMESLETHNYHLQIGHLRKRGQELVRAQAEGIELLNLFDVSKGLRLAIRSLNTF